MKEIVTASVFAALVGAGSVYLIKDGSPVAIEVKPDYRPSELLDEADPKTLEEIALVGPGVECYRGKTLLGDDKEPTEGWVCAAQGEGGIFMPARIQKALDEAQKRLSEKPAPKAVVAAEPEGK